MNEWVYFYFRDAWFNEAGQTWIARVDMPEELIP